MSHRPPPDLARIELALNAYGWTQGRVRDPHSREPRYDTIGLLLRFADVPREEVERVSFLAWHRFGPTLVREYGLRDEVDCYLVQIAGDSAGSHADAIDRVLRALRGDLTAIADSYRVWIESMVVNRERRWRPPGGH